MRCMSVFSLWTQVCPDLNVHACGWQFIRENRFNFSSFGVCVVWFMGVSYLHFPLGLYPFAEFFDVLWRETRCSSKPGENEYLMHNQFYIPNSSLILPYTSHSISGLLSPSHHYCLLFSPRVLIKHLFIELWTGTSPDCPTLSRSVSISPLTPFPQSVNLNFFLVSLMLCFAVLTKFLESAKSPVQHKHKLLYISLLHC